MNATIEIPAPVVMGPDDALPLVLLRDEVTIDAAIAEASGATRMIVPLAALVVAGFVGHGLCLAGIYWPSLGPQAAAQLGAAWVAACVVGFFAAIGAGLPSYWFYGVVAQIRAPSWRLAVELVRVQAVGAVVLAGILPFWLAAALGVQAILGLDLMTFGPWLAVTYGLPFLAATPGIAGLYRAFGRMRTANDVDARSWAPLLLTAWWVVLFLFTAPITIWAVFAALL